MRFLFASDSFKGSLSSEKIIELLSISAKKIFPDCDIVGVPIADGGEGTKNAVLKATNGTNVNVKVFDPLYRSIACSYGKIDDDTAIIEMAEASGLPLVEYDKRNPLKTTSIGTGELIKDALDKGFTDISIAIGGSATNDGGIGAMIALGVKFLDKNGAELRGRGSDLIRIKSIDTSSIHKNIKNVKFTVMCDVDNPLTGKNGATYTFGAQKGADKEMLQELEKGMNNYANVINETFGIDINKVKGAGAAGGLGASLKVFLNAELKSGIETVLDLIKFDNLLDETDVVITGEGRMDFQSAYGKVASGVGKRCKSKNIPAIAIVGGIGKGYESMYDHGITSVVSTVNSPMELSEALDRASELYLDTSERVFRMIKAFKNK